MASGVYPLLNVADLDRSHAFYKGLGLRTSMESMTMGDFTMRWVTVRAGDDHSLRLFLRDFPGADPEDVAWASGDVGRGVLLNIGVPNARATHAKAMASGAKPEALEENPWGGSGFMVADPDGYYLMVTDRFPPEPRAKKAAAKRAPARRAKKGAKKAAKQAPAKASKKAPRKASKKARRR